MYIIKLLIKKEHARNNIFVSIVLILSTFVYRVKCKKHVYGCCWNITLLIFLGQKISKLFEEGVLLKNSLLLRQIIFQ